MTFFASSPLLARALAERNYNDPTPVQSAVLAKEAEGRDIAVSAQTGSGKTVAYGLAIAAAVLDEGAEPRDTAAPRALVIAPTRELAMQVERELGWLYEHTPVRIVSCVGGMDPRLERRKLADGAEIVVGTPGRLRDHIERRGLDIASLAAVVLDEADEMLDLGFREDLEFILGSTPETRRTLLFSATMPRGIVALARRFQRDALRIEVAGGEHGHADIEYRAIRVVPKETELAVVNLLRFVDARTAIVFANTRESVRHLQATLLERGFSTVILSGELGQHERNRSMQDLRDGRARVCVATDVAARGIDLPDVSLVVHAELPRDAETLQHRSGRTGRAGRKGVSALLVPPSRRRRAEQLLHDAGITAAWSGPPTAEEIHKLDQERLLQDLILMEAPAEEDFEMARLLLAKRTPEQLGAALARIYRTRLPALEHLTDPGNGPERRAPREFASGPTKGPRTPRGSLTPRAGLAPHPAFSQDMVLFRLDIGRSKNADPKWLLPMLCRKGKVTKQDIGAIRIFEHETKFEVTESVATQFTVNMQRVGGENVRIERLSEGPQRAPSEPPANGARPKRHAEQKHAPEPRRFPGPKSPSGPKHPPGSTHPPGPKHPSGPKRFSGPKRAPRKP